MDGNKFDILNYLNDLYMAKMAPEIDVRHAGGYHNIHDNESKADEEILENNKKRINIPNAEIKHFSLRQEENFEEYNESETNSTTNKPTEQDGTGYYEISDETKQERGFGPSITKEVVQI